MQAQEKHSILIFQSCQRIKLSENNVIVPNSVKLAFNIDVGGHANNTLVNNLGRNLVSNFKVIFGGETLQDTKRYDLFATYHDRKTNA